MPQGHGLPPTGGILEPVSHGNRPFERGPLGLISSRLPPVGNRFLFELVSYFEYNLTLAPFSLPPSAPPHPPPGARFAFHSMQNLHNNILASEDPEKR